MLNGREEGCWMCAFGWNIRVGKLVDEACRGPAEQILIRWSRERVRRHAHDFGWHDDDRRLMIVDRGEPLIDWLEFDHLFFIPWTSRRMVQIVEANCSTTWGYRVLNSTSARIFARSCQQNTYRTQDLVFCVWMEQCDYQAGPVSIWSDIRGIWPGGPGALPVEFVLNSTGIIQSHWGFSIFVVHVFCARKAYVVEGLAPEHCIWRFLSSCFALAPFLTP